MDDPTGQADAAPLKEDLPLPDSCEDGAARIKRDGTSFKDESEAKRFKLEENEIQEDNLLAKESPAAQDNDLQAVEIDIAADSMPSDEDLELRRKELEIKREARKRRRKEKKKTVAPPPPPEILTPILMPETMPSWCRAIQDYRPSGLNRAIENARIDSVQKFVRCGFASSVINELDRRDRSPLAMALLHCNPAALALLLSVEDPTKYGQEAPEDGDTFADADADYADIDTRLHNVQLLHLPLSQAGVSQERTRRVAICYAVLLWHRLADRPAETLDEDIINILDEVRALLTDLSPPEATDSTLELSSRALAAVDLEVLDFEEMTVTQRLAMSGCILPLKILLAAGASAGSAMKAAVMSRDMQTLSVLLKEQEVIELMGHRFWVSSLIEECVNCSAWTSLYALVRAAPDLTSEEFEHIARYAEYLGVSSDFLEAFRRAIEEDEETAESAAFETPVLSSGIFTHPDCGAHLLEPTDIPGMHVGSHWRQNIPENPGRLEVLLDPNCGALKHVKFKACTWNEECSQACLADILRVHDAGYLSNLQSKSFMARDREAQATAPIDPLLLDTDTPISAHSWTAALYAAGCVIDAVKAVCEDRLRNVFCCVRPPGHHLGSAGACQPPVTDPARGADVLDSDAAIGSQGFCLLNNVAIGAAYARYHYPSAIRRIAIVDFDIHHGNGTEQIIRNLGRRTKTLKFTSEMAHGTIASMSLEVPNWKLWRDETDVDNVMFASIHGFDGNFYPATGAACRRSSPLIVNVPVDAKEEGDFRTGFSQEIIPTLIQFKPDLIMISAGFDGHAFDAIGTGFSKCSETDFAWITTQLVTVANVCCRGRIVSVLEGGYNTHLGLASPFARSVTAHVDALAFTSVGRRNLSRSASLEVPASPRAPMVASTEAAGVWAEEEAKTSP